MERVNTGRITVSTLTRSIKRQKQIISTLILSLLLIVTILVAHSRAQLTENAVLTTFSPAGEVFFVKTPCSTFELVEHSKNQSWRIYRCRWGSRWFFITSTENEESSQLSFIKQLATGEIYKEVRGNQIIPAELLKFADYDGLFQTVASISRRNRFYLFHAVSETKLDPIVDEFVKSIGIREDSPIKREVLGKPRTILEVVGSPGVNKGYISRETSWLYRNPNQGRQLSPSPDQTSPFKVLDKPKPAYTGLALLYEVQGNVKVKVTFEATGHIGEIVAVDKLPMGLTANAMATARFIGFEPGVKDGKAITSVRPVVFNFAIY